MKLKNILLSGLSLVLVAALAIGGTVAYLQDDDSDVNVMTLGNVKIAQHEYERVQNADGTYEMVTSEKYGEGYKLQPFTQAKPLYPATGEITGWGTKVPFDQLGKGASGAQAVFAGLNNVQDKFVLVENTGKTDAYVRTLIALEYGSNTKDIIGISTGDFWTWNEIGLINVDGNNYCLFEAVYKGASSRHVGGVLPAGEYTYNSLAQVYLMNEATNEDVEALDGNKNGTYDIIVLSQAVQTAGFADAQTALDTAFGKSSEKAAEWFGGVALNPTRNAKTFEVTNTQEAQAALDAAMPGDTINFAAGDYGMLYFRQSEVSEIVHDRDYAQSVYDEVKLRTFKDLTINGNGAKIEGFATEAGTYYNGNAWHSNAAVYPVLESFIVLENVKIDNVAFTAEADAISVTGKTSVDGLTVTNCTMNPSANVTPKYVFVAAVPNGAQPEYANVNGATFKVQFANVTIDHCSASYIDRFVLAHISKNLTVTNCTVTMTDNHFINLQGATEWAVAHTGTITVTNNNFTNGHDRFFRAAKVGDAKLVIERNNVFNPFYNNSEPDEELVKVDVVAGTNVTYTNVDNGFGSYAVVVQ